jgi:hypothetical protein
MCAMGGAILCIALYIPAWESTIRFLLKKQEQEYYDVFGSIDILALLTGSRWGAWVMLCTTPILIVATVRHLKERTTVLLLGALGPVLFLWVSRPYGDAYAYARYLAGAWPLWLIIFAAGFVILLRRLFAKWIHREWIIMVVGILIILAIHVTGPLGFNHTPDGPYANCYQGLYPLPAFDVPYDKTPVFYRRLAQSHDPVRLLEWPALPNRSQHLFRNYYLQHGKETYLCIAGVVPFVPSGPYGSIEAPEEWMSCEADYLVVHRNVLREVEKYWAWIYDRDEKVVWDADVRAYMERHKKFGRRLKKPSYRFLSNLAKSLGKPFYEDTDLIVWDLSPR